MAITDSGLCPYPRGDSSIRRMALEARGLGFDSLAALGIPPGNYAGIPVTEGTLIEGMIAREIATHVKSSSPKTFVMARAGDNGFNRAVLGIKGIHVLCGIEAADRHAFDHVTAKIASDNRVAIDISLAPLIRNRGHSRQKALNRYRDILNLSRKYSFPLVLSTHAASVLEMRSVREMSALASVIGFELEEIEQALGFAGTAPYGDKPVQVIS